MSEKYRQCTEPARSGRTTSRGQFQAEFTNLSAGTRSGTDHQLRKASQVNRSLLPLPMRKAQLNVDVHFPPNEAICGDFGVTDSARTMTMKSLANKMQDAPEQIRAYKCFRVEHLAGIDVLALTDAAKIESMNDANDSLYPELNQFIETTAPAHVVIDFADLTDCSRSVIGALIHLWTRLKNVGVDVVLCRMDAHARDKFKCLNLEGTVFAIYSSLSDARAALGECEPPSSEDVDVPSVS